MRQPALMRRVGALLGKAHLSPPSHSLDEWSQVQGWRRLFLPSDFRLQALVCHEETRECHEFTTEYLSLRENRRVATLQVGEARKYHGVLSYHPQEFRNHRVTLIENEEKVQCSRCKGKGRTDCSPEVRCPSCKGRRTRIDFCFTCGGSGRAGQDQKEQCWSCRGRGTRSEDCAACAGVYTGSTGRVRCNRCGGVGWVVCRTCSGAGEKVQARLVTRNYTYSTDSRFRLEGLDTSGLTNGLAARHFKPVAGDLVHRELQAPAHAGVILQRLSIFSYAVELRTYRYRGTRFFLSRISSGKGARVVTKNLPWSRPRVATACILVAVALAALSTALLVS